MASVIDVNFCRSRCLADLEAFAANLDVRPPQADSRGGESRLLTRFPVTSHTGGRGQCVGKPRIGKLLIAGESG
jgi:hypothetical protein